MRLLIVDDEPSILELLGVALKALGTYKVKTATSAKQAMAMIEDKPREFDAFLLDIQMPGMNGIELCESLRENPHYKSCPIIMLTAMSTMSYVEKAFEAGATDYVTKPFDFENLKQRLNSARKMKYAKAPADAGEANPALMRSAFTDQKHEYAETLDLGRVERFIGVSEFDNYVAQMSRSKATNTAAFAVKIKNGAQIAQAATTMEFHALFVRIAQSLSKATTANGSLWTYRGNGVFLCAEYGSRKTDTDEMAREVGQELARLNAQSIVPSIVVGEHAKLETFHADSTQELINGAMSALDGLEPIVFVPSPAPAAEAQSEADPLPRTKPVVVQRPQANADGEKSRRRPDRQAYERMLLDCFRNG